MPVCSYLVIPEAGSELAVVRGLNALAGCEVVRSVNRPVLILVTETAGREEDEALRRRLDGMEGIAALILAFGEIEATSGPADPAGAFLTLDHDGR